jgi:hypothetical protein
MFETLDDQGAVVSRRAAPKTNRPDARSAEVTA